MQRYDAAQTADGTRHNDIITCNECDSIDEHPRTHSETPNLGLDSPEHSLLSGSMHVTGRQKMIETIQKEQIQASKGRQGALELLLVPVMPLSQAGDIITIDKSSGKISLLGRSFARPAKVELGTSGTIRIS